MGVSASFHMPAPPTGRYYEDEWSQIDLQHELYMGSIKKGEVTLMYQTEKTCYRLSDSAKNKSNRINSLPLTLTEQENRYMVSKPQSSFASSFL